MGVTPVEAMEKAVGKGHYHPGQIHRFNTFKYNKGTTVYLLDMPDGKVLVMQSWTPYVNKGETAENLKDLDSQFKELPPGWKFRVKVLDRDLAIAPPALPVAQADRPLSVRSGDPRGDAAQRVRRAVSGHLHTRDRNGGVDG